MARRSGLAALAFARESGKVGEKGNAIQTKRILITGYYGFGNAGDEAILAAMLAHLRALRPDLRVTVVSGNPEETAASHRVDAIDLHDPLAMEVAVRGSDLVLIGGGGLFHDYWGFDPGAMLSDSHWGLAFYTAPAALAAMHCKPLMLYAVGVGPLPSEVSRQFTKAACAAAASISVRDAASKRLLEDLGVPGEKISVTADPAFGLTPADSSHILETRDAQALSGARPRVGVALRHWDIGVDPDFWEREVATALDLFLRHQGGSVLFVSFQTNGGKEENDFAVAERVRGRMKEQQRTTVLDRIGTPSELAGLLAACDLVLAMRLHAAIFAVLGGSLPVALSYDPKVSQLMEEIGFSQQIIELGGIEATRMARVMSETLAQREAFSPALRKAAKSLRAAAKRNARMAIKLLERGPQAPSPLPAELVPLIAHTLHSQLRTVAQLRGELDKLRPTVKTPAVQAVVSESPVAPAEVSQATENSQTDPAATTAYHSTEILKAARGQLKPMFEARSERVLARVRQSKGTVVILPNVGWGISLFQRPHQLAVAFARLGFVAIFDCSHADNDKVKGFKEIEPNLFLFRGPEEYLHRLPEPTLWALPYNFERKDAYPPSVRTVYDWIDDLSVFPHDRDFLERSHTRGLAEATIVTSVSSRLHEMAVQVRPDALYLPNGVEYERFADEDVRKPDDSRLDPFLRTKKPLAGYYGALAEWYDYGLLDAVAQMRPDWNFLLIGPQYDASLPGKPVFNRPNVLWIGPLDYKSLPGYLALFDVAMIPFQINEITLATSPIKLFEFFAAGKPVITTRMPECQAFPEVNAVNSPEEFSHSLDVARRQGQDPAFRARLRERGRENSWMARVMKVTERLDQLRGSEAAC